MKENCFKGGFYAKAFTLIELLVVVLIIGILAAVAVPQYKRAVEKSHIVEAVANLRAIANAHQVYYLSTGEYLDANSIGNLDIEIPGAIIDSGENKNRIQTKDWLYSPTNTQGHKLWALAQRTPYGVYTPQKHYYLYIHVGDSERIHCVAYDAAPDVEKKLCADIEANGTL